MPAVVVALSGCAGTVPVADVLARPTELTSVPFHPQERYQCGPAALATVLQHTGVATSPEALVERVYVPGRRGSLRPEMTAAIRDAGLLAYRPEPTVQALLAEVVAGRPALVMQNLGTGWWPRWHYAVVIGADPGGNALILRSGTERRRQTSAATFQRTWRRAEHWAVVALPPGELPAGSNPRPYLDAVADLEETGAAHAAATAYRAGLARWPGEPLLALGLANALYSGGDAAGAEAALTALLETRPQHVMALNNLAVLKHERGRAGEAQALIERALALNGEARLTPLLEATRDEIAATGNRR